MEFEHLRPNDVLAQIKATAHRSAYALLTKLRALHLNIVTAESLTAGLIASTLVDVPTFGANVYGSLVVYDTDAKRRFLNVTTQNVYTATAARQMSEGALRASRAMVGLSVTGHGGPVSDPAQLGVVHAGVSVRTGPNDVLTRVTRLDNCNSADSPSLKEFCAHWTREVQADEGNCGRLFGAPRGCSSLETLSFVREAIRWETTRRALDFVVDSLEYWAQQGVLPEPNAALLPLKADDAAYVGCHEPSRLIRSHLLPASWSGAHPTVGDDPERVTRDCPEAEPTIVPLEPGADPTNRGLSYGRAMTAATGADVHYRPVARRASRVSSWA